MPPFPTPLFLFLLMAVLPPSFLIASPGETAVRFALPQTPHLQLDDERSSVVVALFLTLFPAVPSLFSLSRFPVGTVSAPVYPLVSSQDPAVLTC